MNDITLSINSEAINTRAMMIRHQDLSSIFSILEFIHKVVKKIMMLHKNQKSTVEIQTKSVENLMEIISPKVLLTANFGQRKSLLKILKKIIKMLEEKYGNLNIDEYADKFRSQARLFENAQIASLYNILNKAKEFESFLSFGYVQLQDTNYPLHEISELVYINFRSLTLNDVVITTSTYPLQNIHNLSSSYQLQKSSIDPSKNNKTCRFRPLQCKTDHQLEEAVNEFLCEFGQTSKFTGEKLDYILTYVTSVLERIILAPNFSHVSMICQLRRVLDSIPIVQLLMNFSSDVLNDHLCNLNYLTEKLLDCFDLEEVSDNLLSSILRIQIMRLRMLQPQEIVTVTHRTIFRTPAPSQ